MSLADNLKAVEFTSSSQIIIDKRGAVHSTRFDDIYFYPEQGLQETQHVFIEGNALPQRWQTLRKQSETTDNATPAFCIAELGFGSGLNFLATAECWLNIFQARNAKAFNTPTLYYYSVEKYPLTPAALNKIYQHCQFDFSLGEQLLAQYPDPVAGEYCLTFQQGNCRIVLVLLYNDALPAINSLESYPHNEESTAGLKVDAWYMDGFTPTKNSAMWSEQLCQQMARLSKSAATLATFSVARTVRDHLSRAGFRIAKKPGFGEKRDMLTAVYNASHTPSLYANQDQLHNSCYFRERQSVSSDSIAIIGSGIAGSCLAWHLASVGKSVLVFDTEQQPASAASGNRGGILFARTGKQRSLLSDLHENCFHYAVQFYKNLSPDNPAAGLCGMLKLGETLPAALRQNPELKSRQWLDQQQAGAVAGLPLSDGGIYYPDAGFIAPRDICQTLLAEPGIEFIGGHQLQQVHREQGKWRLEFNCDNNNSRQHLVDKLILCTGEQTSTLPQTDWLPIKAVRGQSSCIPATLRSAALRVAVCNKGYIAPARQGLHDCGASFNLNSTDRQVDLADELSNRNNAQDCFNQAMGWDAIEDTTASLLSSRVAFRATSPDYLPIAGPLANPQQFAHRFAPLARNAKQAVSEPVELLPGLYVNTAYGSHGFTLAPLISQVLAAEILSSPLPISDRLRHAIAPNRFLLRALIRGQKI